MGASSTATLLRSDGGSTTPVLCGQHGPFAGACVSSWPRVRVKPASGVHGLQRGKGGLRLTDNAEQGSTVSNAMLADPGNVRHT